MHAYDRGGSYVAGIAGLELPIGDPVHHPDGAPFDAKTPGYWLAEIPEAGGLAAPIRAQPQGNYSSPAPSGCAPPRWSAPSSSATSPRSWRPGSGRSTAACCWAGTNGSATPAATLDTDDPDAQAARNQAKVIRTHGIGIIGSDEHLKGKTGYSPERRLHVLAKAKANIVYRLAADRREDRAVAVGGGDRHRAVRLRRPGPGDRLARRPGVVRPRLRPVQAGSIRAARRASRLSQRPRLPRQTRPDPRSRVARRRCRSTHDDDGSR